jgi:hypothetical protein
MLRQGLLLMFPLPHGSAESMDQDHRWAGPDIKIGNPLIMDEHCLNRERFNRSACEWLEVGRNRCRLSTSRHENREEAWNEQSMSPGLAWGNLKISEGTTPVE